MVRSWIADVTPLYDEECYRRYYEELPDFRKKKADALRSMKMKAQSVGVWSLWGKIRAEYNLPEFSAFNLSLSGTWVMCAASMDAGAHDVRVGCDMEKTAQMRKGVAERFFCAEECSVIFSGRTQEERDDCFFRYWVLKESFMKATGKGMALPMNSFCIRLGEPPVLVRQPGEFPEKYYYREYEKEGLPYKMAVCSTDEEIDTEIHMELRL